MPCPTALLGVTTERFSVLQKAAEQQEVTASWRKLGHLVSNGENEA